MALTKQSESQVTYLQVKHFCLWKEIKTPVPGCDEIEVTNPSTKQTMKKHGYKFDTVTGRAIKLVKYDTEKKYSTRYFGFKMHLMDGTDQYVLDMPYNSEILRRFLRVMPRINWSKPISITVFKGRDTGDREKTGIWFQQDGETVKAYFTREEPHGMPEASFDKDLQQWDFRAQHRWLVEKLQQQVIPAIEAAAAKYAPPEEIHQPVPVQEPEQEAPPFGEVDDSDVPF